MVNYTAQSGEIQYNVVELVADTVADIANLPTNCAPGSTCVVIENSSVWIIDSAGVWHEL